MKKQKTTYENNFVRTVYCSNNLCRLFVAVAYPKCDELPVDEQIVGQDTIISEHADYRYIIVTGWR